MVWYHFDNSESSATSALTDSSQMNSLVEQNPYQNFIIPPIKLHDVKLDEVIIHYRMLQELDTASGYIDTPEEEIVIQESKQLVMKAKDVLLVIGEIFLNIFSSGRRINHGLIISKYFWQYYFEELINYLLFLRDYYIPNLSFASWDKFKLSLYDSLNHQNNHDIIAIIIEELEVM